jgi:hypothetical protein
MSTAVLLPKNHALIYGSGSLRFDLMLAFDGGCAYPGTRPAAGDNKSRGLSFIWRRGSEGYSCHDLAFD